MKRFFYILLAALLLLTLAACAKTPAAELTTEPADEAPDWQTKYDLGVRYLSEGKYEEAILAFTAAIEIDPSGRKPSWAVATPMKSLLIWSGLRQTIELLWNLNPTQMRR